MIIVGVRRFCWTAGETHTKAFRLPDGWGPTRCTTCGSHVPESYDGKRMWVPAGLMDDAIDAQINGHIFVASKADWDTIRDNAPQFAESVPA